MDLLYFNAVCSIKSSHSFPSPNVHFIHVNAFNLFKPNWYPPLRTQQLIQTLDSDSGRVPEPHSISVSLCSQPYTTERPGESTITGEERPVAGPRNNDGEVHIQRANAHRKVGFVSDAFYGAPEMRHGYITIVADNMRCGATGDP
ncbi:hypothetical protein B0H14DRAFT_2582090 [Mycena olivaceomarginata]|nr:hypothetical protein B0H14DRAFT_2582090 [Mycena olivaceomarginata]